MVGFDGGRSVAAFKEVAKSAGVDEKRTPNPGMVVPAGGSNIVRLIGGEGLRLEKDPPPALTIQELKEGDIVGSLALLGMWLGIAAPLRVFTSRYFRISGKVPIRNVDLIFVGGRGNQAKLTVSVLGPRPVKLSVRPLQVGVAGTNALVWDSKQPFDVTDMLDRMNAIWIPQANVSFTCRDVTPVPLDEAAVLQASGLSDTVKPVHLSNPDWSYTMDCVGKILNDNRDQSADLTMFLVHLCGFIPAGGKYPKAAEGVTDTVIRCASSAMVGSTARRPSRTKRAISSVGVSMAVRISVTSTPILILVVTRRS
jgi:hypothetical protein